MKSTINEHSFFLRVHPENTECVCAHHKKREEDDSAAPNISFAAVVLLSLRNGARPKRRDVREVTKNCSWIMNKCSTKQIWMHGFENAVRKHTDRISSRKELLSKSINVFYFTLLFCILVHSTTAIGSDHVKVGWDRRQASRTEHTHHMSHEILHCVRHISQFIQKKLLNAKLVCNTVQYTCPHEKHAENSKLNMKNVQYCRGWAHYS